MNPSVDESQLITKLWVNRDRYIEVDAEGYYLGQIAEGAFGTVLCLKSRTPRDRVAWKLPKLTADTVIENYYIEYLLQQEAEVVIDVRDSGGDPTDTLLRCRDEIFGGAFKGIRLLAGTRADQIKQDGHAFFIQFRKGRRPRLCLVKWNDGALDVIPPGVKDDLLGLENKLVWQKLQGDGPTPFSVPSFFAQQSHPAIELDPPSGVHGVHADTLANVATSKLSENVWFAGLSSVQWDWAERSLQQTISEGIARNWAVVDHLTLWSRVLDALVGLHSRNYLHADIRPANVFCRGDARVARNYYLGDYGSLSGGDFAPNGGQGAGGNTIIGSNLAQARSSPFYSLERRAGAEREAADTAVVIYEPGKDDCSVWLGWKSHALDADGSLKTELADAIRSFSWPAVRKDLQSGAMDRLRPGDRLQLRDKVFKVRQTAPDLSVEGNPLEFSLLCQCDAFPSTIIHDKLTLRDGIGPEETLAPQVIPLSSFIELRQWSAATDIFSFGALLLYTLYSSGRQLGFRTSTNTDSNNRIIGNQPSVPFLGSQGLAAIDAEFRQILIVLESVPYLRVLWPDLDYLWNTITTEMDNIQSVEERIKQAATTPGSTSDLDALDKERASRIDDLFRRLNNPASDKENLRLKNIVSNITQSVPHIKVVLQQFQWNIVHFVLFLHYVLRCLHRTEHLADLQAGDAETTATERTAHLFCRSRTDQPGADGPAPKAREALKQLYDLLSSDVFKTGQSYERSLPDYDVRSEYNVKIRNGLLEAQNGLLEETNLRIQQESVRLSREVERLKDRETETEKRSKFYRGIIASIITAKGSTGPGILGSRDKLYQAIEDAQGSLNKE